MFDALEIVRKAAKRMGAIRMPSTPLNRLFAWEYRLRMGTLFQLSRAFYYQPMFEALCDSVGDGFYLDIVPSSKMPVLWNVRLRIGRHVRISAQTTITGARLAPEMPVIEIGDHSFVGYGVSLCAGTAIHIGRHVLIAGGSVIAGDPGHPIDPIARMTEPAPVSSLGRIVLEDHVWIGHNASVIGDARIGEGSIVGARAVVTKNVPAWSLVVGNPARIVRDLRGLSGAQRLQVERESEPRRAAANGR